MNIEKINLSIENNNFCGFFANSTNSVFYPAIIIGGSEGRIHNKWAKFLAYNSISALALGYFNCEGISQNLEYIQLEYFLESIEWIKNHTKKDKVVLIGYSHGAQVALLLGSLFPSLFYKIICFSPISYLLGGFPYVNKPAWKYQNKDIAPYLNGIYSKDEMLILSEDLKMSTLKNKIPFHNNTKEDPYIIKELFEAMNKLPQATESEIKVENITCPILLFSGKDDKIWPSSFYCQNITNRLKRNKSFIKCEHIEYEYVGHGIFESYNGPVFCRLGEFWCTLGGMSEQNDMAEINAWQKTIEFIKK